MRSSISTRLTAAFIGLAIGSVLLVGVVLAWQSFTTQRQQALNSQREVAQRVSTQVKAFFDELENQLRITSQVQGLQKLDRDRQRSILSEMLSYQRVFEELVLLDSQGQEQIRLSRTSALSELGNRSAAEEFMTPRTSGQVYYSPVGFEETTGEPLMTIAVPLLDTRTGLIDGVLVAEVRIKTIWDLIAGIQVSPGQNVYIVDAQGKVVAHPNPSVVLRGTSFRVPDQAGLQPGLAGSNVVLAVDKIRFGQQVFSVVAEQTVSEALALAINTVLITAGLVVVALVISGALGVWIVRQIVQPVQRMATIAQAISGGDLSQQVKVTSRDELGVLANAFNGMTAQLRGLISGLEQRVTERTAELSQATESLAHRVNQLQASAEVSRAATTLTDPEQLIPQVVELIQQRFEFYYVGLFLVDADNRYAVLQHGMGAGSAYEAGRVMKQHGHRLEVGSQSMVGWVCANRQARIALDVGQDAVRFVNPLLPDTRSEMALPLQVGERVIGVLDIQSAQMAAFDESDIAALQGMADQVAVALENARLLQQAQAALKEIEETNRLLVREGWQGYLEQKTTRRAEFLAASGPFQDPLQHKQALQTEPLTIPIELRGQSLGRLTLRREGSRAWSEDETQLIQTIALQTVLAAENARLVEQTQMALRETEGLFKAAVAISGPTDLREICQNLASHFHDLVQADRTVLTLVNQQRKQILLRVGHGNITEELQMTFEELSAGLGGQVMATGQPVLSVTTSDKAESEATRERRSRLNIGSLIVAPLITKGGVVGIAGAYRRTDQRPFTQHDVELLMALTAQAAMAVENVRLLEETQRRAEREQLIRQITTRIRAAGDVQGVLETTATELAQSMGASRAIVRLTMGDDA